MRMLLVALGLVSMSLVGGRTLEAARAASQPLSLAAAQPALPAAVQALLPADARIIEGFLADLTDDGESDWAILYVTPRADLATWADSHVTAIIATPNGWQVALDVVEEYANGGEVARTRFGVRELLQAHFYVGAHAGSVRLYLWDGAAFTTVLEEFSNAAAFEVRAEGVITWFSPYCGSFATSPMLFRAHWWDGEGFIRDDGRDAALVAEARAAVEAAFDREAGETASGRACLYDALAYLDLAAGDEEDAAHHCAAVWAEEPEGGMTRLTCTQPR